MDACSGCNPCGNGCENNCKQASCLSWGFDGCYLRGRCPDGTELEPLDLCAWLKKHETCTVFQIVPDSENGGYMQYLNECGDDERLYVCDFLSLGDLECLHNVYDREPAQSCDLLVYSPDCGDDGDPRHDKWSPYHIPDAGTCTLEPDENGYYKVLTKTECGCIKECNLFAQSKTWHYTIRDSWPDDPDEEFVQGSQSECIDLMLDTKCPMFGVTDLEVTFQYGFGIQHWDGPTVDDLKLSHTLNAQSVVTPVYHPTTTPSASELYGNAITVQGNNFCPIGSHEWQVSRTVVVPKGEKLYLAHNVKIRDWLGNTIAANTGFCWWRLHQLHVFVRPTKGVKIA